MYHVLCEPVFKVRDPLLQAAADRLRQVFRVTTRAELMARAVYDAVGAAGLTLTRQADADLRSLLPVDDPRWLNTAQREWLLHPHEQFPLGASSKVIDMGFAGIKPKWTPRMLLDPPDLPVNPLWLRNAANSKALTSLGMK